MTFRRALLAAVPLLLLLVAAPAGAVPSEPPARASIPRTYDAALAHVESFTQMRALRKFYTPSGNIYCNVGLRGFPRGCEIDAGRIRDPDACPGQQQLKTVGRLEFRRFGVAPVCNTDTIQTPRTKVLRYGQATASGPYVCISESIGVTCLNVRKKFGFFLHRGEYVLFSGGG
jgi:hypothetical protein